MNPFLVLRQKTGLFTPVKEKWSQNTKVYSDDSEYPGMAVVAGRKPGEPMMVLLGGGLLHREEMSELAERIRERKVDREVDPRWMDKVREAFADRIAKHRANPVTDPAQHYT